MYTEIEKRAIKFLEETDTAQFSTMELLTMFAKKEQNFKQANTNQYVCKNCDKPFTMHSRASGMCPDTFKHFE